MGVLKKLLDGLDLAACLCPGTATGFRQLQRKSSSTFGRLNSACVVQRPHCLHGEVRRGFLQFSVLARDGWFYPANMTYRGKRDRPAPKLVSRAGSPLR